MTMYGTILPIITSSGRTGVASRFSIVPRSRSRVIARPVIITIVIVRITPIRPGTMLYCVIAFGVVAAVDRAPRTAAAPRASGASGPMQVLARNATRASSRQRGDRVAGGRRVGRIGLDQQRRPLAAQQPRA